jgi:hypothetical protein
MKSLVNKAMLADLFFVYTDSGNWCFVSAELAEHEKAGGEI